MATVALPPTKPLPPLPPDVPADAAVHCVPIVMVAEPLTSAAGNHPVSFMLAPPPPPPPAPVNGVVRDAPPPPQPPWPTAMMRISLALAGGVHEPDDVKVCVTAALWFAGNGCASAIVQVSNRNRSVFTTGPPRLPLMPR
jgi:hypothetical protein